MLMGLDKGRVGAVSVREGGRKLLLCERLFANPLDLRSIFGSVDD